MPTEAGKLESGYDKDISKEGGQKADSKSGQGNEHNKKN